MRTSRARDLWQWLPKRKNHEEHLGHLSKRTSQLLRVAGRIPAADHVRADLRVLLLELGGLFQHDEPGIADARRRHADERERVRYPAAAFERQRDRPVLYSDDHHAAVCGREAHWHHRTAGYFADSRSGTDPGQWVRGWGFV